MPGARKGIPKEETYKMYGDAARKGEIKSLLDHGALIRVARWGIPIGDVCINGWCVYTKKNKPLKEGHTKTEVYVGDRGRLGGRFSRKVSKRR